VIEMTRARFALLAALAVVGTLLGAPTGAAAEDLAYGIVPVDHRERLPLRVHLWTDRGDDAVYHPGERVLIRVTANDDAYVSVYDIDTEGRVRVLFPALGSDGFVRAREVVTLPGPHADFDYVVTGPPGIETIEAVASRARLRSWEDEEWEDEGWDEDEDSEWDDEVDWDEGGSLVARPRATGLRVAGDPFVAVRRVNHRLVPDGCDDRDYDSAYASFYVGERVSYPRYSCNDCHGPHHGYDPYADHCSVFSVRVNVGWVYPRHHVTVIHRHRVTEPRYVYVRHRHVPARYKHLKRTWPASDRATIRKEFSRSPGWKAAPPKMRWNEPAPPAKSRRGYRPKTERSEPWGGLAVPEKSAPGAWKPAEPPPGPGAAPKVKGGNAVPGKSKGSAGKPKRG
jgi:hypothetical protein